MHRGALARLACVLVASILVVHVSTRAETVTVVGAPGAPGANGAPGAPGAAADPGGGAAALAEAADERNTATATVAGSTSGEFRLVQVAAGGRGAVPGAASSVLRHAAAASLSVRSDAHVFASARSLGDGHDVAVGIAEDPEPPQQGPARIVLIVVDTLREDQLAAFGSSGTTPRIDALARRGRALGALASFHQTTMSMGALFTGRTPSIESGAPGQPLAWNSSTWCGLARFAAAGDARCLPASLPTLAEALRRAGYSTIGVTSNPLLFEPAGFARGFDDWTEVGRFEEIHATGPPLPDTLRMAAESRSGPVVNRAAGEALARRKSDRFFLYVHFMDAHDHQETGEAWHATSVPPATSARLFASSYRDGVRRADAAVGALLQRLEAEGVLEGAVVILTSDHGERLGEQHGLPGAPTHRGNPAFDTLVRVPLVVAPDRTGAREGPPIRTQDLFQLVLEIAELEAPDAADLAPDELYLSELRFQTLREQRWKSLHRRSDGHIFLFDLSADPGETRDVADAHPDVVAAHRERVAAVARSLSAPGVRRDELSAEERQRLGALGYLEDALGERRLAGNP